MTNKQIAQQLDRLTASLQVIDARKYFFQIRSYQNASEMLKNLSQEVSVIYHQKKDLEFLPGIGRAIEEKMIELLETGHSKSIDQFTDLMPQGMFPLLDIPNVGAKKAYKLAKLFGLDDPETSIDLLEQIAKSGKVRDIEGFGEKSEQEIIDSIDRLRHSANKIPYSQANSIALRLIKYIKSNCKHITALPLGSLRRHKKQVGDIDIGISTHNFTEVKNVVKKYPELLRVLADGDNLIRLLLIDNIQVDVKASPPERWGAFLQHFTGSKEHNIKLRELALKQGKSLSEHGIKLIDEGKRLVEFADEVEFYNYLGLKFIPPEQRIGDDEIEKAKL